MNCLRRFARLRAGLLGAVVAAGSLGAHAAEIDFVGCDGYSAPSKGGDGMLTNASPVRARPGEPGIAACDAALAELPAQHWRRRVNLLRARAVHQLSRGDSAAALADLDRARIAIEDPADAYNRRSLGLTLDLVRAYAQRLAGDQGGAEALALRTLDQRPYATDAAWFALFAMGYNADARNLDIVYRRLARMRPDAMDLVFVEAFDQRRFAEVIGLYGQLRPNLEEWSALSVKSRAQVEAENFLAEASLPVTRAGYAAYALAATGRAAEARRLLAEANAGLHKALAPLPPLAEGAKPPEGRQHMQRARERLARLGESDLAPWTAIVEARILADEAKDPMTVRRAVEALESPPAAAILDIGEIYYAKAKIDGSIDLGAMRQRLANEHPEVPTNLELAFQNLMKAEAAETVPHFRQLKSNLLLSANTFEGQTAEGFRSHGPNPDGFTRVAFHSNRISRTAPEEMALLRAAQLAQQAGKGGLIVVRRTDIGYESTPTMYVTRVGGIPRGFTTQLDVLFVDPASLPAGYEHAGWRVIDVAEVIAELDPLYGPSSAVQAVRAKKR